MFWTDAFWNTDRIGAQAFISNQSLNGAVARLNVDAVWRLTRTVATRAMIPARRGLVVFVSARIVDRLGGPEGAVLAADVMQAARSGTATASTGAEPRPAAAAPALRFGGVVAADALLERVDRLIAARAIAIPAAPRIARL